MRFFVVVFLNLTSEEKMGIVADTPRVSGDAVFVWM